jgi:N-methylhydantoinase A/oxoprolinase/acetone carboxylase beta subunit
MGFFTAPRAFDLLRSHKAALSSVSFAEAEGIFQELETEAAKILHKEAGGETISYQRSLDMRFVGQGSETNISVPNGDFAKFQKTDIRRSFDEVYEKLYGRTYPESEVEFINFRVRASLPARLLKIPKLVVKAKLNVHKKGQALDAAIKGKRQAFSPVVHDFIPYTVYDRYRLFPGAEFTGPAIIEEKESTLIVGEGAHVATDEFGFLWIDLKEA